MLITVTVMVENFCSACLSYVALYVCNRTLCLWNGKSLYRAEKKQSVLCAGCYLKMLEEQYNRIDWLERDETADGAYGFNFNSIK